MTLPSGPKRITVLLLCVATAVLVSGSPLLADDDDAEAIAPGYEPDSVQWGPLLRQSALFLGIEHGFRFATEPGTRDGLHDGGFFRGYIKSVTNFHGWADGDPFLVNYVGHPMQGSVTGDIWIQNDPKYRTAEFGRDRRYWTGRLRATAFAWAYSEQFEIGPFSEASLGHVQHYYPQQGLVDHVITPVVGFGWMIAEDAIDVYIIKRIEAHTRNNWVRLLVRGGLNPSRSFANLMAMREPWVRTTRPGVFTYDASVDPTMHPHPKLLDLPDPAPWPMPRFEFTTAFNQTALGIGDHEINCSGGGANAVYNLNSALGIEGEISGCKMLGMPENLSGDANFFLVGPRLTYSGGEHWRSYLHVMIGPEKLTEEKVDPVLRAEVQATAPKNTDIWDLHNAYTRHYESTGMALQVGGGVEYALNRNFALRVGELEINHNWLHDLNGEAYPNNIRLSTGLVLRVGSAR